MIVVIIAGGSGTRLWPLSTPNYPKHLLKVNGDELSLLQHTYKRARNLTSKVFVVSEASHIKFVKEQLSDLPENHFIVEPGRRGTANCIIASLAHISSQKESPEETIAFMHADHYIRDLAGFTHSFRLAERVSEKEKRLVLVGVEPDGPSTGLGYIEKGELLDQHNFVYQGKSFKEKPDHETARKYIRSGNYLWNGGYFVASLNTFSKVMNKYAPKLWANFKELQKTKDNKSTYLSFKPEAIDYALIEKVPNLLVIPANFDWIDLGSYSDLTKTIGGDELGNYTHGSKVELEEVKNSYVHNDEDKPVVVIGLNNVVVVNTPDGILVTRKDLSQKVGDISKRIAD